MGNAKQRLVGRFVASALLGLLGSAASAEAQTKRIQLEVLVVSNGDDVGTSMVRAGLDEGLIPYTVVDLARSDRPILTDEFMADNPSPLIRRAKFQAVVLPSEAPSLSGAERDALVRFEREFGVRQLDAYVYPSPAVGMNWPANPGYSGALDGMTGRVTAAGSSEAFSYLAGALPIDDLDPQLAEVYGYLATPMEADTVLNRFFASLVEVPIPNSAAAGVLVGVYSDDGREEMILTAAMNQYQVLQQTLLPGMLNWLTYGVHLGSERNYFAVHIDDVFLSDSRWDMQHNCTVADDCPAGVTAPEILMTPGDVDQLIAWQQQQGIVADMVFNGTGYDQAIALGAFPLGAQLLAHKSALRWVNHSYGHAYLGCVQDFSVQPWRCATTSAGRVRWTPYATIVSEISQNLTFAARVGISLARAELVTGEHSGLRRAPEEPSDNPYLALALWSQQVAWAGSDNSRESAQRALGAALTVPRYPMNIYYNTATKAEAVDEYNWIYGSLADGGSGLCENNPSSTCVTPLDLSTGFDAYIVPREARIALLHVLTNSPRPHFAHQSNLAEERILYPVLDKLLADYRALFAQNAPVVNFTMTEAGSELRNRSLWTATRPYLSGYIENGKVVLSAAGSPVTAPVTVPAASSGGSSLSDYAGVRTGWEGVSPQLATEITLPSSVLYTR